MRADVGQRSALQGAPGTGKTAVGLHRVAYLLYAYKERVARRGVLVIGPNRAFLAYIRNVLPALGEIDVSQVTVTELAASVPFTARTPSGPPGSRGRPDGRRAAPGPLGSSGRAARRAGAAARLAALAGIRLWPGRAGRGAAGARPAVRSRPGPARAPDRARHPDRDGRGGGACDDRTHHVVRRTRPVRAAVDAIWPKVNPVRLVFGLLSDPGTLRAAAAGILDETEQRDVCWESRPAAPGRRAGHPPTWCSSTRRATSSRTRPA